MRKAHAITAFNCGISAFILCTAFFLAPASAQERCKVDDPGNAGTTKYTQQHALDVGDVPGHQIRVAQLHTTFTDPKPNCEGLKPTESENFISTDYTDRNGTLHGYIVTTYDNGDKIFQRQEGVSQTITNADGSKSSTLYAVVKYVGGTGKYNNIQGLARTTAAFDPVKNHVEAHTEGEYWIEK
jgi:hypothetical protein